MLFNKLSVWIMILYSFTATTMPRQKNETDSTHVAAVKELCKDTPFYQKYFDTMCQLYAHIKEYIATECKDGTFIKESPNGDVLLALDKIILEVEDQSKSGLGFNEVIYSPVGGLEIIKMINSKNKNIISTILQKNGIEFQNISGFINIRTMGSHGLSLPFTIDNSTFYSLTKVEKESLPQPDPSKKETLFSAIYLVPGTLNDTFVGRLNQLHATSSNGKATFDVKPH